MSKVINEEGRIWACCSDEVKAELKQAAADGYKIEWYNLDWLTDFDFDTEDNPGYAYRCTVPDEPKLVPFERDDYAGIVQVRNKNIGSICAVIEATKENIVFGYGCSVVSYKTAASNYEQLDGSPLMKPEVGE